MRLPWMLLLLVTALPPEARAGTARAPLAVGEAMPDLEGRALTGQRAVLPAAARGRVALVALGFSYASRFPVEKWAERFRASYGKDSSVALFEVPMLAGMARMARPFIDGGMRRATPVELHEYVITTSGQAGHWKPLVGFQDEDAPYLLLIDRSGRVAWRHAGPPDDAAWEEFVAALERARQR